jgi:putative aldouronate transport system permease protein
LGAYSSVGRRVFIVANYAVLLSLSALCILPFVHIVALSLSGSLPVMAGDVGLWPLDLNLDSFRKLLIQKNLLSSVITTIKRVFLGVSTNFILTVLVAYPLSKESRSFRFRTAYAWFFIITMLVNGGVIPWFLTIRGLGLLDNIWALILPGAVPIFNVLLLLNFFRGLPRELEEAAKMDGARHFQILTRVFLPISYPALATISLLAFLNHWNSWFDGTILMNSAKNYPLQSFLRQFVGQTNAELFSNLDVLAFPRISEQTVKSALIVVTVVPIVIIFPFFQKFLRTGLVMGSVKQ